MKLKGKAALVTGGGTGMGRAICLKFAGEGCDVIVNYSRRNTEAEETAEAARKLGVKAVAVKADIATDAECRRLVQETVQKLGRIDILVNNAGWSQLVPHRDLDKLTEEIIQRTFAVNTYGPLYLCRAAIPHMQRLGGGRIVNITSIAAFQGAGSSVVYCASKAALASFTRSLARAFAKDNILVNSVAPGFVDTHFVDWPREAMEKNVKVSPMGRIPTVDDIANATLFLACDATGVTAHTLLVDCGVTVLQPVI